MSSPELSTKSAENDALEATAYTTTTTTNNPPPLCDDCTSDRPTPSGQAPNGEVTKLSDVDVYISKPASYPTSPARLLLLLTGGTGLLSTNNQLQADRFAAEGYVVVMPDLFGGDPAPNSKTAAEIAEESNSGSFLDVFKVKAAETAKSFMIDMWLARHTEEKVLPLIKKVLEAAKDEFADAVTYGGGVYAAGYCFGGRYVLLLGQEKEVAHAHGQQQGDEEANRAKTEGPWIKAGALAHATLVSTQDFVGLKVPVSVVSVESDPLFPDEVRTAGEDVMRESGVEHEVQVYPGVPHGEFSALLVIHREMQCVNECLTNLAK